MRNIFESIRYTILTMCCVYCHCGAITTTTTMTKTITGTQYPHYYTKNHIINGVVCPASSHHHGCYHPCDNQLLLGNVCMCVWESVRARYRERERETGAIMTITMKIGFCEMGPSPFVLIVASISSYISANTRLLLPVSYGNLCEHRTPTLQSSETAWKLCTQ